MQHHFTYNGETGELSLEVEGCEVFRQNIVKQYPEAASILAHEIQKAIGRVWDLAYREAVCDATEALGRLHSGRQKA